MRMAIINCEQCRQDVEVPYAKRFDSFCSRSCYKQFYHSTKHHDPDMNEDDDLDDYYSDIIYGGQIPEMVAKPCSLEQVSELFPLDDVPAIEVETMELDLDYDYD